MPTAKARPRILPDAATTTEGSSDASVEHESSGRSGRDRPRCVSRFARAPPTSPGSRLTCSARALHPRDCSRSSCPSRSSASPRISRRRRIFRCTPARDTTIAGVVAFLLASTLAERFPVPVEGADANGVSLGLRLRRRGARALRLGARDVHLRERADDRRDHRPAAADPDGLQLRRVRARRHDRRADRCIHFHGNSSAATSCSRSRSRRRSSTRSTCCS